MKSLYKHIHESILDDIETNIDKGGKIVDVQYIRELYYSVDRRKLSANWKKFKKHVLKDQKRIKRKDFVKGKLYIGATTNDFTIDKNYSTITYFAIYRAGQRIIHINQNNFIHNMPYKIGGFCAKNEDYPLGIYQIKGGLSLLDFGGKFNKVLDNFAWYEAPQECVDYIEKVILKNSIDYDDPTHWDNAIFYKKDEFTDIDAMFK